MLVPLSLEVLITHTKELGQILTAVHQTSTNVGRMASIPTVIMITQLALKHWTPHPTLNMPWSTLPRSPRRTTLHSTLLPLVTGIEDTSEGGHSILHAFVETTSSDNSHSSSRHYLTIPPVSHLSSIIFNSPILAGDCGIPDKLVAVPGCVGGAASTGGVSHFLSGIDPSLDPELAMMSMEEAARQVAANAPPQPPLGAAAPAAAGPDSAPTQSSHPVAATDEGRTMPDIEMTEEHEREEDLMEEEMIMQAIMMSVHPEVELDVQGIIQKNTATREAAKLANCSKSEFLANMSHEIRLAWWIGYLENRSWSDDHGASLLLAPADYFRNPTLLIGDSLCLWQVIADLVGNAIKFTPSKVSKKGHVALSCRLLALDNSSVTLEFCVLDTSIGIAKDKLNFNFDTFAQADGSTTRLFSEGIQRNGIGLSISKHLIALMAGSMQVESEIGKGSKFFTITSQIGQLSMDVMLAKMAPFGNYFIH
ncbi:hypothetical protein F5148DRAFT_1306030 [Russula earlei]|uniref:Uncharacterized protein n=1 Tax=Russula earlei TaxID=71964 RepID=A0ACC0U8U4_9AGAM|nr:hypothetical protein F5148DRAFT_1306030 [Russula earlei]